MTHKQANVDMDRIMWCFENEEDEEAIDSRIRMIIFIRYSRVDLVCFSARGSRDWLTLATLVNCSPFSVAV